MPVCCLGCHGGVRRCEKSQQHKAAGAVVPMHSHMLATPVKAKLFRLAAIQQLRPRCGRCGVSKV